MRNAVSGPMVFTVAVLVASPATAQWTPAIEAHLTPAYDACMKQPDAAMGNDPAMTECSNEELVRQDARLNAVYRAAMARTPAKGRTALRADERRWIATRDRTCEAVYQRAGGGTASRLEESGCRLEQTIRRAMFLERRR